jgi:hypothetical protein
MLDAAFLFSNIPLTFAAPISSFFDRLNFNETILMNLGD